MRRLSRPTSVDPSQSRTPSPVSSSETTNRTFPTRSEWESWKEVIRELYIDRNMTLSRLRDHMALEHGFHAEDHEYKRRLAQWRFRKNYTSAEKEAVAVHLDNFRARQHSSSEPEFLLNDRPLRMDKIERHRKAARRQTVKTVALQFNSEAHNPPQDAATFRFDSNTIMDHRLGQTVAAPAMPPYTFPFDHNEAMLWNVPHQDQTPHHEILPAPAGPERQDRVYALVFNIVRAVHRFAAGEFERATQILDDCCSSVEDLLRTETWNFMMYMTVLQTLPAWEQARCRELYRVVYTFFASMSQRVLGPRHPVSNFLHLATEFDARREALETACALVLELGIQQYDMVQSMTNYSGGIVFDSQGGLDYRLLQSDGLGMSTTKFNSQANEEICARLKEMFRLFSQVWYAQDVYDLETAALLMAKRKKTIEEFVRRLVEWINTCTIPHSTMTQTTSAGIGLVHGSDMDMGLDSISVPHGGMRRPTTRYLNPGDSMPEMAMSIEDLDRFTPDTGR